MVFPPGISPVLAAILAANAKNTQKVLAGIKEMEGRLATKMDSQGTQIPSAKVNLRDLTSRVIRVESSLDARIDATVSRAIGAAVDRAASNRLSPQLFPPLSTATDIS